ncbi:methyltransferase domain-containing protein [Butyrivibrio proteoclasticus]|uniref:methyltransferase domain-containing protein n=1 Tax=Butyrivibrio proteoclasticus TaxID=43305 RepID=UPI00047A6BD5|nr:class I SAM-dependent methyltransferase [Butyrivibrio proteoclasticus]
MTQISSSHYNFKEYNSIGRWASYYYQVWYCLHSGCSDVLIIGKGDGLLETILKKYDANMRIVTFDYADDLNPDICGNVLELSSHCSLESYSLVVCCQVLEHLPFDKFDKALLEISKVLKPKGRLILSLPDSGICPDLYIHIPKLGDFRIAPKICKFYRKEFEFEGQHYWEINSARKYPLKLIRKKIHNKYMIQKEFLVPLNAFHRFFICEKM